MRKQFPAPQWADDVNHWLNSLKAAAYSPATLSTRRCQLTALSHALGGSPLDVDADELVDYFASRSWKPETRKSARNAVVSFFRWLQASGKRDDDPSDELPSVRRPQAHPRPCPDRVILQAMQQANDEERLMLRLGAECGLRRSEIAATSSADVLDDVGGRSLMVRGKGDKQRIVPLPDDLADEILGHDGYCFPGRFGGHVEATYVGKRLSRLLGDWTPHSLRHRYATRMYEATGDIMLVSKLLGHESVETTQRYVAMPDSRLRVGLSSIALGA